MAAIEEGTMTFEALRRKLGVGTGNCKAKRCRSKIEQRICDYKASLNDSGVSPIQPSNELN